MAHFDKHSTSIKALIDVSEAMLNAMEEHGIDPETVSKSNEFTVMIHFLKSIIDGELNIPNELTDRIRDTAFQLDLDQKLNKKLFERVQLQLLGKVDIRVATDDSDKVDLLHHKNATAPNLIHSLDASLLHLSALRFDAPISPIHDSALCRATDMSVLSAIVRETYMHLFAEHDYLTSFAQQIGAETDPPMIDDLEPSSVIESTYFFC